MSFVFIFLLVLLPRSLAGKRRHFASAYGIIVMGSLVDKSVIRGVDIEIFIEENIYPR